VIETGKQAMEIKPWGTFRKLPKWWDPDRITKGRYMWNGLKGEGSARFWIDETEGRAFFLR